MNEIIKSEVFNELAETQVISKKAIIETAKSAIPPEMNAKEKIDLCTRISAGELYLKTIKDAVKSTVNKDDVKLTGNILGADINYGSTKTVYDYASDLVWSTLNAQLKAREETLKNQRQLWDKHMQSGNQGEFIGIVETTGETVPIVNKEVYEGIKITLKN